jgi:hypothetical protein
MAPSSIRIQRAELACVAAVCGVAVLLWNHRLGGPIDYRFDAGVYYVLGTSLAEGKGYRLLSEPGEIQALQYPPLLPAFVAIHQKALGTSDPVVVGQWLRRSYFLIFVAYAGAVYALARRFLPRGVSVAAALVCLFSFHTFYLSDMLFAELPFAFVSVLFVLAMGMPSRWLAAVAAPLGIAAYLLRTLGIALLAAWVAESLSRRRFRQAAMRAAIAVVPVVGWQTYVAGVRSSAEYARPAYTYQRAPYQYYNVSYAENAGLVDPFVPERGRATRADLAHRVAWNVAAMPFGIGEAVSAPSMFWKWILLTVRRSGGPDIPDWTVVFPTALLGLVTLCGIALLVAAGERFVPLYIGASAALICLTPWPEQFNRYLSPLSALLSISMFVALLALEDHIRRSGGGRRHALRALSVAVLTSITIAQWFTVTYSYKSRGGILYEDAQGRTTHGSAFFYDKRWSDFDAAVRLLKRQARRSDVVAASAPHVVYLYAGLKAVLPPYELDAETALRLLDSVPVTWVIVDEFDFGGNFSRRYAFSAIVRRPDLWTLAYTGEAGRVRVYRRSDAGGPASSAESRARPTGGSSPVP